MLSCKLYPQCGASKKTLCTEEIEGMNGFNSDDSGNHFLVDLYLMLVFEAVEGGGRQKLKKTSSRGQKMKRCNKSKGERSGSNG